MTRPRLDQRTVIGAVVAALVVGLTLVGGGYADAALGAATLIVWVLVVLGILSGALAHARIPLATLAAGGCLLGLLGLTILSMSWTSSDESAFAEAVRLAGYLGVFALAALAARPSRFAPALVGLATGAVLVALLALGSRLLGIGGGDAELVAVLPTASGRLSYTLGYWNALGAFVVLALPVLCWLAAEARSQLVRALALAGFGPVLLAAYMTSSRGALIAAAVGLGVAAGYAPDRRRAAAAVMVGVAGAMPAVLVATLVPGILDTAGEGAPGGSEVAVIAALLLGVTFAVLAGTQVLGALTRARFFALRVRARTVLLVLAAAATLLIVLAGPSALIGDLRSGTDGDQSGRAVGIVSASGSGRAQFWSTALDAFATEPVRGIGAGGYEAYWSENGSLQTPARNAHSEPLELLAELGLIGLVGFAGFLAIVLVSGSRFARQRAAGPAAAALGLVAAGLVGFAIDWTWQIPAVVAPILVAAAFLTACSPRGVGPAHHRPGVGPRAVAIGLIVLAVPAVWAGGLLAVTASKLEASSDALARGQLDEAAAAARTAAAIEPWASEPWLRLGEIERAGSNFAAAQTALEAAIDRAPQDYRAWLLATRLQIQQGNEQAGLVYAIRAFDLAPSD